MTQSGIARSVTGCAIILPRRSDGALMGVQYLAPLHPQIFMGTEYDSDEPWLFFASHQDEAIRNGTRTGRFEDYRGAYLSAGFKPPEQFKTSPDGEIDYDAFSRQTNADGATLPDPVSPETFEKSKLQWRQDKAQRAYLQLTRDLFKLRHQDPRLINESLKDTQIKGWEAKSRPPVIAMRRRAPQHQRGVSRSVEIWETKRQA